MPAKPLMLLCAFVIAASLLLGGGTRGGLLSDVVLQLIGLPLLVAALWCPGRAVPAPLAPAPSRLWLGSVLWPSLLLLLAVLIPVLQLVPMPGGVPGGIARLLPPVASNGAGFHGGSLNVGAAVSTSLPVLQSSTLSVAPHLTWLALLALITPAAVFFATARLPHVARRQLTTIILVVGVISVFVGLLQLAQGPVSSLRFYEITNDREAVGFFANRNHFSALLYCLTLLAGAWVLDTARTLGSLPLERRFETSIFLPALAVSTLLVVLLAAQGMTRSRTGLGLTIVAIMGVFALALPDRRRVEGGGSIRTMSLIVGLALVLVAEFALYGILERFGTDPLADPRVVFARNTMVAARAYMPFGSGVGTFVPVYGMFETPGDALIGAYVNRAHNDFLEIWLESGVAGVLLIGLFMLWVGVRMIAVWRPTDVSAQALGWPIDHALARAATLVIVLLIAHSTTDYPLRTGALLAVFAFAVALLVPAPPNLDDEFSASVALRHAEQSQTARLTSDGARPRDQPDVAALSGLTAVPVGGGAAKTERVRTTRMPPAPVVPALNEVLTTANWPDAWRQQSTAGSSGAATAGKFGGKSDASTAWPTPPPAAASSTEPSSVGPMSKLAPATDDGDPPVKPS